MLEFPKPDASLRLQIWTRILGELAGEEVLETVATGLQRLAGHVEVTGAQIKFAMLSALFAAQRDEVPLAMRHLLRGVERELIKDGRALSECERERLLADGR